MMKKLLLIIVIILASCQKEEVQPDPYQECRDIIGSYSIEDAEPVSGLIEGDIIPDIQNKAFVNAKPERIWKDNTVPFYFDNDLGTQKNKQIRLRMAFIESVSNIEFIEFRSEDELLKSYKDGLHIQPPLNPFAGNSSYVGRQGGIQDLTLVDSSADLVIEHEILHSLGFEHEHTRPDRDEYIIVNYDNIPINPNLKRQFDIKENGSTPCGPYDVKSAMQYSSFTGASSIAKKDSLPAITTIEGELIPMPNGLSQGDIEALNILYPKI